MGSQEFPPGFRFQPTDVELVKHYLQKKNSNQPINCDMIIEANTYADHPRRLIEIYRDREEDAWYFFSSRKRKYRNGVRPDRKAGNGYWKASGKKKSVKDINGKKIGCDTGLVYYEKARDKNQKDVKTNWIMHEYWSVKYQLPRNDQNKLDEWVICKIYQPKRSGSNSKKSEEAEYNPKQLAIQNSLEVKIQEDSGDQVKPLKEKQNHKRKAEGILIEDGVESGTKALNNTALKHSQNELPSGDPLDHRSSSIVVYQHGYPLNTSNFGDQNKYLNGNQNGGNNVYDQDTSLNGASHQNVKNCVGVCDQNACLGENFQFDHFSDLPDIVFDLDADDNALNQLLTKEFGEDCGDIFPSDQEYNESEPNRHFSEAGEDLSGWGNYDELW